MKKAPDIREISDTEDKEIKRQIENDPDTWAAPKNFTPLKRGRPRGRTKAQVTVSLDLDLIEALKDPEEKGWQTRLNAAARVGLGI